MRHLRPTALDLVIYIACRVMFTLLACLPRRVGHMLGRVLGTLFYRLSPVHRRVARENIRQALGDVTDEATRNRIARESFAHLGMLFTDVAYFPRIVRQPSERLAVFEGVEHLKSAASEGRGVLVFSGHYGHWELVALLQHRLGVPMTMVVRPLNNLWLDRYAARLRGLSGNTILPKWHAARGVLRALRSGRGVAILIDQNVREGGIFVDFFGRPASTTPSLATLAFRSGAPIVPVFSRFLSDGRVLISYRPAVRIERRATMEEDIHAVTLRCTAMLEEEVTRHPESWLWMHNRWRTTETVAATERPAAARAGAPDIGADGSVPPIDPGSTGGGRQDDPHGAESKSAVGAEARTL